MNHIYRVVFNKQTGTFQAVSETAKSHTKQSTKGSTKNLIRKIAQAVALALGLSGVSTLALAAPTGGQVVAGQANIAQVGNITDINQASQKAVINWQDFGVKSHETVNFKQPNAESLTLNRVIGNNKSVIDGAINANGKVFIQNEQGVLIGKNAQINVGGLVATTAQISNDDFMNSRYQFANAKGEIENLGNITVPQGGVVALVAPIVKNGGTIKAHEGNVLLASAESFSITLPDNAGFAYTLDKGTLQGLIDNGGAILADAGRVVLTAKGVDTVKNPSSNIAVTLRQILYKIKMA
ncbi:Heme:hemopexin utilization protein A [Moraxella lacunata]|uniref:Heme:hemopexin utilization protein A n=1 Tax=Moraxella lacunata TaxID=477 RepID=A0A378T562_MORLA|nr:filamentous hemagglutinin N-terminal domain-containing protein [Moraxella lacunata]STZ55938.1 Heme:hemopexin utilization protein A [Moraxella lacunata]